MHLFTYNRVYLYIFNGYSEHRLLSYKYILKKTAIEFYEELFKKENNNKEAWKILNLLMTKKQYKM